MNDAVSELLQPVSDIFPSGLAHALAGLQVETRGLLQEISEMALGTLGGDNHRGKSSAAALKSVDEVLFWERRRMSGTGMIGRSRRIEEVQFLP